MGTPEFSVPILEGLVGQGHEVVAVYTRAPKPAGRRGLELQPSPVHAAAERLRLPVLTPKSLKGDAEAATFVRFDAEAAVVVAYGLILPKPILEAPRFGSLNLHASLLPRWRGA
ncbi:MAG TPA: methionyl-tRNA formyltransferase, partial [Methylovirgula sp.]